MFVTAKAKLLEVLYFPLRLYLTNRFLHNCLAHHMFYMYVYFILRFLTIIYYLQTLFFLMENKLFLSHINYEKLRININNRINSVSKIVQI